MHKPKTFGRSKSCANSSGNARTPILRKPDVKRCDMDVVGLGASIGNERGGTRPVVVVSDGVSIPSPYMVAVVAVEDAATITGKAGVLVPAVESGAPTD